MGTEVANNGGHTQRLLKTPRRARHSKAPAERRGGEGTAERRRRKRSTNTKPNRMFDTRSRGRSLLAERKKTAAQRPQFWVAQLRASRPARGGPSPRPRRGRPGEGAALRLRPRRARHGHLPRATQPTGHLPLLSSAAIAEERRLMRTTALLASPERWRGRGAGARSTRTSAGREPRRRAAPRAGEGGRSGCRRGLNIFHNVHGAAGGLSKPT